MALTDDFNGNGYKATKINGFVLGISYSLGGNTVYHMYDFMARILSSRTGSGEGGTAITPFSELDRGSLIALRDELVRQGGNPPELPPEAAQQAATKKLNL